MPSDYAGASHRRRTEHGGGLHVELGEADFEGDGSDCPGTTGVLTKSPSDILDDQHPGTATEATISDVPSNVLFLSVAFSLRHGRDLPIPITCYHFTA